MQIVDFVFGRSLFNGYFDLDESMPYSLTGLLTNDGAGTSSQIALFGPGGAIVDVHGSNGVSVPTHLYKVILAEGRKNQVGNSGDNANNSNPLVAAFIVPNKPIKRSKKLIEFW